jgi:hypothetical protein
MKELFAAIQGLLEDDHDLVALLGAANIGQAYSPATRKVPCVAYQMWSAPFVPVDQAKGNRDPQDMTLLFIIITGDDSSAIYGGGTLASEIAERLKALLHGADAALSGETLDCKAALYDDYQAPPDYDEPSAQWRLDLRFRFIARALTPAPGP